MLFTDENAIGVASRVKVISRDEGDPSTETRTFRLVFRQERRATTPRMRRERIVMREEMGQRFYSAIDFVNYLG
jgi:hypothetical protein